MNTGRLQEATDLAVDYINAVLGEGKEHFGLKTPLVATGPAVWLPFNTLELLLLELEHASKDDTSYIEVKCIFKKKIQISKKNYFNNFFVFIKNYDRLKKSLDHYVGTVVRVSDDMIRFKAQISSDSKYFSL